MAKVGVLGPTSWGTTLAILTARNGHETTMWTRTEDEAARLNAARSNADLLPGVPFPDNLFVTASSSHAFADSDLILIAVPSRTLRENVTAISTSIGRSAIVVSATKGIEIDSGKRMSQILSDELPVSLRSSICALSGPNLANETWMANPQPRLLAPQT